MGLVRFNLSELNGRINHWTDFFSTHPRKKVVFYRQSVSEDDDPVIAKFQYRNSLNSGIYLGTHLGFECASVGYLVRQLEPKRFLVEATSKPSYYVTESFEENFQSFTRSCSIALVEGVLDAECFQQITGYPFVMSYLTSSVSSDLAMFLALLSRKVVIVPDADKWGDRNLASSEAALRRAGVEYGVVREREAKDMGEAFFKKELHKGIIARLKSVL